MMFLIVASVSALTPESEGVAANGSAQSSRDAKTELCLFHAEQEFWDSFGSGAKRNAESQTDAFQDCDDVVSGKGVFRSSDRNGLEEEIRTLVSGYPIESMAPYIASYDRDIAALLVGIAKKESDWGKHVPLDDSAMDCFNYWGYKGAGSRGVAMGHGCFGSPEEAVRMVGNRLVELVSLRRTSDPRNMIVWKCGSSCQGHSEESVRKWIADVKLYYEKIARI